MNSHIKQGLYFLIILPEKEELHLCFTVKGDVHVMLVVVNARCIVREIYFSVG